MLASEDDIRARLRRECLVLGHRDRANLPAETITRWAPDERWRRWGITRLGSLTGLDRIGVSVWMSVRPNARTLAVCQGKGLDDDSAAASALMEAIEIAVAEKSDHLCRHASRRELEEEGLKVDLLPSLMRAGAPLPGNDDSRAWLLAHDAFGGSPILLPAEAIMLDDTRESDWWRSSDGLASGNILPEAVLHALCERIERDAMTLWEHASETLVRESCLDPRSLDDLEIDGLVEKIETAGFLLRLFEITTDIMIPSMFAVMFPREIPYSTLGYLDVTSGSGCHPRRAKAVARAVTEAVQSRLTKIAAARDDFDPDLYDASLPPSILLYRDCEPLPSTQAHPQVPAAISYVETVLSALEAARIRDVWLVILADEPGLAVVKAVVPGLESLSGLRAVPVGPRLVRRMLGRL